MAENNIKKQIIFLISVFLLCSCKPLSIQEYGNINDAISNSIKDFRIKNKNMFKKDSIYRVVAEEREEFYRVIIIGSNSKYLFNPNIEPNKNKLPSGVYEVDDKLFLWYDSTKEVNIETVEILKKFDLLVDDKGGTIRFLDDDVIDDSKRGAIYFICKNNLSNNKKIISNSVPASHKFLNCK